MSVEITFEIEDQPERSGIVAENTYLWDAAARLGIHLEADDKEDAELDDCAVTIKKGAENLSTPTSVEMQHLTDEQRAAGERLARQARIQRSGEVIVMVKKKVTEEEHDKKEREWRKDFQELPFEKKFATLVELEAVALGETLSFVANLPYTLSNKVIDVMAGFGWQMDKNARQSRRPQEHQATADTEANGTAAETEEKEPSKKTRQPKEKKTE